MPTTYEPNKLGPFNISVATDVDFTLKELEVWISFYNHFSTSSPIIVFLICLYLAKKSNICAARRYWVSLCSRHINSSRSLTLLAPANLLFWCARIVTLRMNSSRKILNICKVSYRGCATSPHAKAIMRTQVNQAYHFNQFSVFCVREDPCLFADQPAGLTFCSPRSS